MRGEYSFDVSNFLSPKHDTDQDPRRGSRTGRPSEKTIDTLVLTARKGQGPGDTDGDALSEK
jgi:hypothetical protein